MEQDDYRQYIESEIVHIKELIVQYNRLTELAIKKSEDNYNERFAKTNEFRQQLQDMIGTFARQKETDAAIDSLSQRFEQNIKTVTERYESNAKMIENKLLTNAELSNKGINDLNKWKDVKDGNIAMIRIILSFLSAIVIVLVAAFFKMSSK